jgi:hypothetical protein
MIKITIRSKSERKARLFHVPGFAPDFHLFFIIRKDIYTEINFIWYDYS